MIKVRLTLIRSNHQPLRQSPVEGETRALPTLRKPFKMLAPASDPKQKRRQIETTAVRAVCLDIEAVRWTFDTENSRYELELLPQTVSEVARGMRRKKAK